MPIFEISMITGAIVEMSLEALKKGLSRRETVIKILKRLKIDVDYSSDDFDTIYVRALVEYGIFKPEPIINFFRHRFIQDAFRLAFYNNEPSILDREAEDLIAWDAETKELGILDFNPRQQFAAFTGVFNEIVDSSRTPFEARQDQKLDNILERLERLSDLDAIRLELSRLTPQNQKAAINQLAAQMSGWFKTLNYQFENYAEYTDEYFEWIINVPIRRGYDRIFVRGITGEANMSHLQTLRNVILKHNVDEGWLVANRRVTPSVRAALHESDYKNLYCYTFDELLDEHADFTRYIGWLETEIHRRGIDKMYVPLAATKTEIDLLTRKAIANSRYDEKNGWIEAYVDQWLDDPSKEHISLLGEFGTGKTWFILHYAWIALNRYKEAKVRGLERPRIPLVIPLRDYAKAVSIESLFSEFFFRKHEIPLPGYSAFEQLNRMGKLLLLFDGFDEMAARVDRQKMINNFWELARIIVPGSKVILTCRTEHFPNDGESRSLLSAELKASTAKLTGEPPQFEVLKLEMFNEAQIKKLLSFRVELEVVEQIIMNAQLLELIRRPVMIELVIDALPDIQAGKAVNLAKIYLYAVQRKMERDIKSERTFTSLADKLYFMCELSWEMLTSHRMSLNYKEFPDRLRQIFGPIEQEQKELDHWHYDMMGQTMLIRNSDGDYMPAHRSLLEFFVAYKIAAQLGALTSDFLKLALIDTPDKSSGVKSETLAWSEYFRKLAQSRIDSTPNFYLSQFKLEKFEILQESLKSHFIDNAVRKLLIGMIDVVKFAQNYRNWWVSTNREVNFSVLDVISEFLKQPGISNETKYALYSVVVEFLNSLQIKKWNHRLCLHECINILTLCFHDSLSDKLKKLFRRHKEPEWKAIWLKYLERYKIPLLEDYVVNNIESMDEFLLGRAVCYLAGIKSLTKYDFILKFITHEVSYLRPRALYYLWSIDPEEFFLRLPSLEQRSNVKILSSDDVGELRKLYVLYFNRHGFEAIDDGGDPAIALELLDKNADISLLTTDINKPKMDGITMLQIVRSRQNTRYLPVIVLSATAIDTCDISNLKIDMAIPKPFQIATLLAGVNLLLLNDVSKLTEHLSSDLDENLVFNFL